MDTKSVLSSRSIWTNILVAVCVKVYAPLGAFVAENPAVFTLAYALLNIGLRLITKKAVTPTLPTVGALLVGLSMVGCQTMPQPLNPDLFYKRDLPITVNGEDFAGAGVAGPAKRYEIEVNPNTNVDLLLIRSCHREESFEKSAGWFKKNDFSYTYEPQKGLEDIRTCPLQIDALDAAKGQHAWAYLDFRHVSYEIEGELTCNGTISKFKGVGECQAKAGLTQRIRFAIPIRFAPSEGCATPHKAVDGSGYYELETSVGECVYLFDSQDGKIGRIVFLGYQGVLVRSTP